LPPHTRVFSYRGERCFSPPDSRSPFSGHAIDYLQSLHSRTHALPHAHPHPSKSARGTQNKMTAGALVPSSSRRRIAAATSAVALAAALYQWRASVVAGQERAAVAR